MNVNGNHILKTPLKVSLESTGIDERERILNGTFETKEATDPNTYVNKDMNDMVTNPSEEGT